MAHLICRVWLLHAGLQESASPPKASATAVLVLVQHSPGLPSGVHVCISQARK